MPGLVGDSDEDEWDSDEGSDGSTEQGGRFLSLRSCCGKALTSFALAESDPDDVDLAAVKRPALTCIGPPGTHGPAPRAPRPVQTKPKSEPAPRPSTTSPKVIPTLPTSTQRTLPASQPSTLYGSLPRVVPPTCCPPDRCTKVQPHHSYSTQPGHLEFSALDAVLVNILLTQITNAMAMENGSRLEELRSIVVARILSKVEKLDVADPGTRKLIEEDVSKALGEETCDPSTQSVYGRRALITGLASGLANVVRRLATRLQGPRWS